MDQDMVIREKVNEQLVEFCESLSKGLTKPKRKFLHQMIFGIQARKDVKLSEVTRSLDEKIKPIKTENRLSRNMRDDKLSEHINHKVLEQAKDKIKKDTVIALDLTSVEKPYAKKMPFIAQVWSGMKKDKVNGYWALEIVGADVYDEHLLPLYSKLYSQKADKFKSENDQILEAIDTVNSYAKGKGIYVMDRGGDRKKLINPIISKGLRFIIRLRGERLMTLRNNRHKIAEEIAKRNIDYTYKYKVEIDNQGFREEKEIELGRKKVKMPDIKQELWLVVIKGFGDKPMILLTNVEKNPVFILEMYFTRWKVEESIRFLKQEYRLEDMRIRSYAGLQNTISFLSAVFYFLTVYMGRKLRLNILLKKLCERAKRFFQVSTFKQYALADGIFRIFFNTAWQSPWKKKTNGSANNQLTLFPLAL